MLSYELKRELLGIARSSIAAALRRESTISIDAPTPSEELLKPGGAFVTLRTDGELRGCIGYMESLLPLASAVAEVAVKAAFDDPRFPPLSLPELEHTSLEISVLSPVRRVSSKDEVRVGEHGVVLEHGFNKGVLLPQVAVEYGWTVEEFLDAICRKCGLKSSAWLDPEAKISVFTAEVFEEDEILRERSAQS